MRDKVANALLERVIEVNNRVERVEWALAEIAKVLRQLTEEQAREYNKKANTTNKGVIE
jgi:hypothetical protein